MKYKGKKLEGRNSDILVLPRGKDRIVFKAQALENYKEFDKLCPLPQPPFKLLPGNIKEPNHADKGYQESLNKYASKKTAYTLIKSLEITEDLEWETIDLKNPETWLNWESELELAGFTEIEKLRILQLATRVNALDDGILDQAKEAFLAEALQQEK